MPPAIHITGASGSGTSTLGRALAQATGARHLDTDDFYWAAIEPKFSVRRELPERLALLTAAFAAATEGWVLSGSLASDWAEPLAPCFRHVIFLYAPAELRVARLRRREAKEFGAAAVGPGGSRHEEHEAFVRWSAAYDAGTESGRSLPKHQAWLATLACPVLRLDAARPAAELLARSLAWLKAPA